MIRTPNFGGYSRGNLWITTDGNKLDSNDGMFAVPVQGRERGHVKQFHTMPIGAEACGPVVHDDFVLVSVQHPGETEGRVQHGRGPRSVSAPVVYAYKLMVYPPCWLPHG